ncbi:MAG TPA: DNA polymerase III subunit gamma/tau [Solirubrobacteraceae bacterium]|nr:DNA polymerase III subunit gamma/tau [Solirubrobacteraceae bacterium]
MPSAPASLYRRHRPRTFADVVGQDHVVRTLRNAVAQGKVHHAYLFVGSRGTGKTSMAKILAASLNCVEGPTVEPCGVCESCVSIAAATSLDVIEMDAASNNSVDDIRDLRERVNFAPVAGRHKVYILDEAHMLSTAAWNAFLKTLEEPPPHTIFVLATTEANKVLPTVVDRCHRFDFARPSVPQIAGVLRRVATAEEIEIGDEATALVARSATGSFRDALGTLEQLVAYSGRARGEAGDERSEAVPLDDVLAVLGAADADLVFGAIDAVAAGDARAALQAAARLADSGRDLGRYFGDLEAHARALMVVQALGDVPAEIRVTPEQDERLAAQARAVAPADVVRLLELIADALRALKDGADARTQLELALVKAAEPEHDPSTKALLARIERLEARLAGAPAPAAPASRAPEEPATAAGRTRVAVSALVEDQPEPEADGAPTSSTVTAVATVEPDAPPRVDLSLGAFEELWPAVLESLEAESPMLAAMLREARPIELADTGLTLAWPQSAAFSKRAAEDPAKRELIAQSIRAVTGASLRLAHELRADHEVASEAAAPLSDDELVERFKREFGAVEEPTEES